MIIELTAAAIGGGMVGFFACAVMVQGSIADGAEAMAGASQKIDDANATLKAVEDSLLGQIRSKANWVHRAIAAEKAHTRVTDALTAKQTRIDRALEQITPRANATVKRIARILRGEQG